MSLPVSRVIMYIYISFFFFFSSRRRHTRCLSDWSSDVCSSDLEKVTLGDKETGGKAALPMWIDFMRGLQGQTGRTIRHDSEGDYGVGEMRPKSKIGRASCRERV